MATYSEQLQIIWHRFESENKHLPASAREAVAWGVERGLIAIPVIDPLDQLAEDMSNALREEYRKDRYGRRYRVNHAVRVTSGGVQHTVWADMEYADRPYMVKAFSQRRKQIVGDCLQLKTDVDVYNTHNKIQEPIPLVLDFTNDVDEEEGLRGVA